MFQMLEDRKAVRKPAGELRREKEWLDLFFAYEFKEKLKEHGLTLEKFFDVSFH